MDTHCEITLEPMPQNLTNSEINIGSDNDFVPSDIKPLAEPMLTQIFVDIWCY